MKKIDTLILGSLTDRMISQFYDRLMNESIVTESLNLHISDSMSDDVLSKTEIICGGLPAGWTETMPSVRWVYFLGAGIESALTPELVNSEIIVSNGSGIHAIPISEHILGMMLMFGRQLHLCMRRQVDKSWDRHGFDAKVTELCDSVLGIIGLGDIGEALAERAKCMGMKVIATRKHVERHSRYVDMLLHPSELDKLIIESDYIAICAPLTKETRGMIGSDQFNLMKRNAVIINIARGAIIDQDAMIEALRSNQIGGAGLDVATPEPLPSDSPLWDMPNVIISPHVSGLNPRYGIRAAEIFIDNLRHYLTGNYSEMPTLVDKIAGY